MYPLRPRHPAAHPATAAWCRTVAAALAVCGLALAACNGDAATVDRRDTIDADRFVAAWVELRHATITAETGELTDATRQQALERAGVTEEQFLNFSEVHGGDLDFMQPVWDSIEARMDSTILQSPGAETPPPRDGRP